MILPGADPGFPVGVGADPPGRAPTYDFAKFSKKMHGSEKILGCRATALLFLFSSDHFIPQ